MPGRTRIWALAIAAALAAGAADARPLRVMSIGACGDQFLLALLPPDRITSVTWLARDPETSVMARAARQVPVNRGQAEEVLRDRPDLVIAGAFTTPAARALLKRLHVPMLELGAADSFDDIRRQTRAVAEAVGARARGEALIARMDALLRRLAANPGPPLRVAAWDGGGFAAPPGSMYDALLRAAGARNISGGGGGVERLLAERPDLLVEDEPGAESPSLRAAVLDHPAVRRLWSGRVVVLPAASYVCGTPYSADAALRLQAEMRAAAARARPLPELDGARTMKALLLFAGLGAGLALAALVSLLAGEAWITPGQALAAVMSPHETLARLIILDIRLPRLLLGLLVGGILGLSGAVLQGLLRNPLAEPGLLGVSSGASLGAVIALYYGVGTLVPLAQPMFGMVGGLAAAGVALLLARGGGTLALILSGVAVSAVAAAGVSLALNLSPSPYAAYEIMTWLMGSLTDRSWDHLRLAAPFILAGAVLLGLTARSLDALSLGEDQAESLGIDVGMTRLLALLGTALGVGAATAVAGAIGFVGLIAPHLVRPFVGHRPGSTLGPSALAGALIVTAADIGARLIHAQAEIKLGVFVSLVGAPFFLWLVLRLRRTSP